MRDKYDFTYRKNSVPRILNENEKVEGRDMGDEYFLYDHVPVIFWWLRRLHWVNQKGNLNLFQGFSLFILYPPKFHVIYYLYLFVYYGLGMLMVRSIRFSPTLRAQRPRFDHPE